MIVDVNKFFLLSTPYLVFHVITPYKFAYKKCSISGTIDGMVHFFFILSAKMSLNDIVFNQNAKTDLTNGHKSN